MYDECDIARLRNVCYFKITQSTFIYEQSEDCLFRVTGFNSHSMVGVWLRQLAHVIFQGREDPQVYF